MKSFIKVFENGDDLSHFFAQKLAEEVRLLPEGQYFTIALSGGSTPRSVFTYLAKNFRDKIDWSKVKVFWSDERCVPPESEESNYRMAKESLLDKVSVPEENIFRIKGENVPSVESVRYSGVILSHVQVINKIPQFDFMMLGLGDDGHTVSIFPDNIHLFDSTNICVEAENPYSKQKRITLTGSIINHSKTVVFLVCGKSKAEMAARIMNKNTGWDKLPASKVHPSNGKLFWLLDSEAASEIKTKIK